MADDHKDYAHGGKEVWGGAGKKERKKMKKEKKSISFFIFLARAKQNQTKKPQKVHNVQEIG